MSEVSEIWRARSAGAAAMEVEAKVEALTRWRLVRSTRRLKLARKSAPMMGDGDVGHDEVPLVFTAGEGELQGFAAICQDT